MDAKVVRGPYQRYSGTDRRTFWLDQSGFLFSYDDPNGPEPPTWHTTKDNTSITTPKTDGSLSLNQVISKTKAIKKQGEAALKTTIQRAISDVAAEACNTAFKQTQDIMQETPLERLRALATSKAEVDNLMTQCKKHGDVVTEKVIDMWNHDVSKSRSMKQDTTVWAAYRGLFDGPHKMLKMDMLSSCKVTALSNLWLSRAPSQSTCGMTTLYKQLRFWSSVGESPMEPTPFKKAIWMTVLQYKSFTETCEVIRKAQEISGKSVFTKAHVVGVSFLDKNIELQYANQPIKATPVKIQDR
jgi:hypothetical protein